MKTVFPVLIGPGLFFVWNFNLLRGDVEVPRRSSLGLTLLTALSMYTLWGDWGAGVKAQGRTYTAEVTALNGIALLICWGLWVRARARPSLARSLWFHWVTTVWLVWLAFPWLGRVP